MTVYLKNFLKRTNRSVSVMKSKGFSIEEPLFFECLQQTGGHSFVVLTGVADVGEDLGQRLLLVDTQELEVLGQVLLVIIILVDVDAQVVAVGLLMYITFQGQAVGEGRLLVGPSYGEGGYGHDQSGQLEDIDNLLGLIDGGAQIAVAQSFLVHEVTERLGVEQGVGGRVDERQEIVVARLRLSAAGPCAGAVEVGTYGEHDGCLCHHRLVEVCGCQLLLDLLGTCDDDAVELQVAHGLCTACLAEEPVQQFVTDFFPTVMAYGSPCC